MLNLPSEVVTAIAQRSVSSRLLFWFTVRDRDTGDPVGVGLWNDAGTYQCGVIDGVTSSTVTRAFDGDCINQIGSLPMVSDLSVRTWNITLSATSPAVQQLIRTYDARNAPVQVYRAFFHPNSLQLIAAPRCEFMGRVDSAPGKLFGANQESTFSLSLASHTRELRRSSPAKRSDESQKLRSATDTFYAYTAIVPEWDLAWGTNRSTLASTTG